MTLQDDLLYSFTAWRKAGEERDVFRGATAGCAGRVQSAAKNSRQEMIAQSTVTGRDSVSPCEGVRGAGQQEAPAWLPGCLAACNCNCTRLGSARLASGAGTLLIAQSAIRW